MESKTTMSIAKAKENNKCRTEILDNFKEGTLERIYYSKKDYGSHTVYKVYVEDDIYILKIISCGKDYEEIIEEAVKEYELGLRISKMTKGIVKPLAYELYESKNHMRIEMLYEYGGESMNTCIEKISLKKAFTNIVATINTFITLHENGIFHSDIKPNNIVVKDKQVKIIDFGTSIDFGSKKELLDTHCSKDTLIGHTEIYSPPEILLNADYIPVKVDVYCWGMTLYQLAAQKDKDFLLDIKEMRIESENYPLFLEMIENLEIDGKEELIEQIKEVLLRVLSFDPNDRPSFEELKELIEDPKEFYKNELAITEKVMKKLKEQRGSFISRFDRKRKEKM